MAADLRDAFLHEVLERRPTQAVDVERLGEGEARQDGRQGARQQGLACAGRSFEQAIMAAGAGDLQDGFYDIFWEIKRADRRNAQAEILARLAQDGRVR